MITKIEINGFKTFEHFELLLAPFIVIAGSNGSGKSNLFDAIKLLSDLAEDGELIKAFDGQRGSFAELFTLYNNGMRADKMQFAVELFLDRSVTDEYNNNAELSHRRLRYELHIAIRQDEKIGLERLYVEHESLAPIKIGQDRWRKEFLKDEEWEIERRSQNYKAYISTETEETKGDVITVIKVRQDGGGGRNPTPVRYLKKTVLSGIADASFPHAFAVRNEMLHWRQFQLNPIELRKPSAMLGDDYLDNEGKYLASMLKAIEQADPHAMRNISRSVQNILPDIKRIYVEPDHSRDQFVLMVESADGRKFSSNVLSEGTLRIIALTAMKFDERYQGIICFEEPENGIHPFRMKKIIDLLKGLSTDFESAGDADLPLRQVLINTHSPNLVKVFFDSNEAHSGLMYYSRLLKKVDAAKKAAYKITRLSPVKYGDSKRLFLNEIAAETQISHTEVIAYLESDDAEQHTIEQLNQD